MAVKLTPEQLYRYSLDDLPEFTTTADLAPLENYLGQERAIEAVQFGIGIRRDGYNLYAMGPAGVGKYSIIHTFLQQQARKESTPREICYVYNFQQAHQPISLSLPQGMAIVLKQDMKKLVEDLLTTLPAAFESEDYRERAQAMEDELNQKQSQAMDAIHKEAEQHNIRLFRTPGGYAFTPMQGDDVLSPSDFDALPAKEQKVIKGIIAQLQDKLADLFRQVPLWRKELIEQLRELERDTARSITDQLIEQLKARYLGEEKVLTYLDEVEKDVLNNVEDFLPGSSREQGNMPLFSDGKKPALKRYEVNILTDYSQNGGAPVIFEDHPTFENLLGRIEHISQLGTLITDFTLIKPGALHRANGGYLILEAYKVLTQPMVWDALKRALRSKCIKIETLASALSLTSTQTLQPEAVELDIKIVLIGDRMIYYLLCEYDEDFSELFKVAADFDTRLDRSRENLALYSRLITAMLEKESLLPMQRQAVARTIEHSSRLLEDSEKLSAHMGKLIDLLVEADHWARAAQQAHISHEHIQQAINAQIHRASRVRDLSHEAIQRNIIMIDTSGEAIAQVNGLSVMELGNFHFAQPSRITASVRLGEGHVLNIEREVELSGPI
ncbi:MAG: AAA family ATPase, partial [Gammaproteobacteria bacterium]|nr:AAA family ATPase [Gammaproteobacteria bacterium]